MHAHSDGFINMEKMDEGGRLNENKQYCKNRFMNGDLAKQDGRGAVAELSNALLSFLISMKQTKLTPQDCHNSGKQISRNCLI